MNKLALLCLGIVGLSGCQGDERVKEVSQLQLESEKLFLEKKTTELESDLSRRLAFHRAVEGTYEGVARSQSEEYRIRFRIWTNLSGYIPDGRVRTPEEVVEKINALKFNIQVVQWRPESANGFTGCQVMGIEPEYSTGEVKISNSECPSFYQFVVLDEATGSNSTQTRVVRSRTIARDLMNGLEVGVSSLFGHIYPKTPGAPLEFKAERKEER